MFLSFGFVNLKTLKKFKIYQLLTVVFFIFFSRFYLYKFFTFSLFSHVLFVFATVSVNLNLICNKFPVAPPKGCNYVKQKIMEVFFVVPTPLLYSSFSINLKRAETAFLGFLIKPLHFLVFDFTIFAITKALN